MFKRILFGLIVAGAAVYALMTFTDEYQPPHLKDRFVVIGTGGETGVYYPVGQAICALVNANLRDNGVRCGARATAGSYYNIEALRRGELEYAIVQSDWQYYAVRGSGGPQPLAAFPNLRAIMALHPEVLTIVVRRDAKIRTLSDLEGKRVNLGLPGSGQRESIRLLFETMGQQVERLVIPTQFPPEKQASALCEGSSDALVYLAGQPNDSIAAALARCDTLILPLTGEVVDRFLRQNPFYSAITIPGNTYPGQTQPVRSVGLLATLVTTLRESDQAVYQLASAIYSDFDGFKTSHPALAGVEKENTFASGLTAPLHGGVLRYLRDAGLTPRADAQP